MANETRPLKDKSGKRIGCIIGKTKPLIIQCYAKDGSPNCFILQLHESHSLDQCPYLKREENKSPISFMR